MPVTHFDCKAGLIATADCLKQCPVERCLSLPTLHALAENRVFKPPYVFSTTQLLNPTRIAYLQMTKDYAVNPKQRGFMLLGTRHHERLDEVAKKVEGLKSEMQLGGEVSGILDLLEPRGDGWALIDYKTVGVYAIKKMLNNDWDSGYDLQLNNYRIKATALGFPVTSLYIQYTARDGGTKTYKDSGISEQIGLITVPILPDDTVIEYFWGKDKALRTALETNTMPPICDSKERWGGRRCGEYCDVAKWCKNG